VNWLREFVRAFLLSARASYEVSKQASERGVDSGTARQLGSRAGKNAVDEEATR
jgi:hypothetical protein